MAYPLILNLFFSSRIMVKNTMFLITALIILGHSTGCTASLQPESELTQAQLDDNEPRPSSQSEGEQDSQPIPSRNEPAVLSNEVPPEIAQPSSEDAEIPDDGKNMSEQSANNDPTREEKKPEKTFPLQGENATYNGSTPKSPDTSPVQVSPVQTQIAPVQAQITPAPLENKESSSQLEAPQAPESFDQEKIYVNTQNFITIFQDQKPKSINKPFPKINPHAPKGGKINLSCGVFDTLNPFSLQGNAPESLLALVHATLFREDLEEQGVSYPYVAERIKIYGNKVTFYINPKACFHNGDQITAEDVLFSFHFITQSLPHYKSYYGEVSDAFVEPSNPLAITFVLSSQAPKELPLCLGQLYVLPQSYYKKIDTRNALEHPVGAGPYRLVKSDVGRFLTYERVQKWWGEDLAATQGFYNFDHIHYECFRDPISAREAFKKGELDWHPEYVRKDWIHFYDFPAVHDGRVIKEAWPYDGPGKTFIFNTQRPIFQDIRVRKALFIMLPFEDMNQSLFDSSYNRMSSLFQNRICQSSGEPSDEELAMMKKIGLHIPEQDKDDTRGILTDGAGFGYDAFIQSPEVLVNEYMRSPDERKKLALHLFQQAGWVLSGGKLTHPKHGVFQCTLLAHGGSFDKIFQRMKISFASIGIVFNIKNADPAQYRSMIQARSYDMIIGPFIHSSYFPGTELLGALSSSQSQNPMGNNYAGINNPWVDKMVTALLNAKTQEDLKITGKILDRILLSNYYAIPAWYPKDITVAYWSHLAHPKKPDTCQGFNLWSWWIKPGR